MRSLPPHKAAGPDGVEAELVMVQARFAITLESSFYSSDGMLVITNNLGSLSGGISILYTTLEIHGN